MIKSIILIAALALIGAGQARAVDDYAIGKIDIDGRLRVKTFFGPPNYGELPKTDSHEEEFVLIATGSAPVDDQLPRKKPNSNVDWIQLVIWKTDQSKLAEKLVGKCVTVKGTIGYPQTGHYHTALAIEVDDIAETKEC